MKRLATIALCLLIPTTTSVSFAQDSGSKGDCVAVGNELAGLNAAFARASETIKGGYCPGRFCNGRTRAVAQKAELGAKFRQLEPLVRKCTAERQELRIEDRAWQEFNNPKDRLSIVAPVDYKEGRSKAAIYISGLESQTSIVITRYRRSGPSFEAIAEDILQEYLRVNAMAANGPFIPYSGYAWNGLRLTIGADAGSKIIVIAAPANDGVVLFEAIVPYAGIKPSALRDVELMAKYLEVDNSSYD